MSLYNRIFGVNPFALELKTLLNLDGTDERWPTGRFRDIYLDFKSKVIILYTRNGGRNRKECNDVMRDYD